MDAAVRARLLASMEAGRLVILCGAGLSMAPPSSLPSAWSVAASCYDRYVMSIDPACPPELRGDLEALAEIFARDDTLGSVFIEALVPWESFVRPPNAGHAAVADFLITRMAAGAVSANYDNLIERRAQDYGFDLAASLDGDEATVRARKHAPLLKFHGCSVRERRATVWTASQLTEDGVVAARIAKTKTWMAANLREKDLLVVGFWSDWSYLNAILAEAMTGVAPLSVTLVDLAGEDVLQAKAPELWTLANSGNVRFAHVRRSGAEVLDELRRAFSQGYLRKVLHAGRAALERETGAACEPTWLDPPDLGSEDLYGLRRDAEGVPATAAATLRNPGRSEVLGYAHLLLRRAGAVQTSIGYDLAGRRVRVVNGSGTLLQTTQDRFRETPFDVADVVVCAGAIDVGLPVNLVREGRPGDIIRPGASAAWLDLPAARQELGV